MKINISNLSEGTHEYNFDEIPSDIGLDERFSKTVSVRVTLEKRRRQLFLTGHVDTSGRFACDRCLDDFEKSLSVGYRMVYVYDESDAGEIDKDEITVLQPSSNAIELDDDVRQYIFLAIPLKLLCKDDCAGLCGTCGANLNHMVCDCPKDSTESDVVGKKPKRIVSRN